MTDLEKLFSDILLQLKEESKKYKKLKICKYSFEISGGPTPFLPMGKMCLFPIFPHGEKWKKSIWKKREKYSSPSLSIYFFPHFFPWGKWGKMGKDTIFP